MKCWKCAQEGASRGFVFDYWQGDEMSPVVKHREELKERESNSRFDNDITARMFCPKCYAEHTRELSEKRREYAKLKKSLMLERAVRILEKQALNIYDYKDLIEQMETYVVESPEKFDSAHEMIAAIILADNAIEAQMQYRIGKYRVDFFIPGYKIVLEIDGEVHKRNLFRDNERDIKIREILGTDWEIVRIGTKYLEENAKALVDAMIAVKKEKQKIRRAHHGFLPDWYSQRNKAKREKELKTSDDEFFDL